MSKHGTTFVVDGHTLVADVGGLLLQVLRASIRMGSLFSYEPSTICRPIDPNRIRPATTKDFEAFGVHIGSHIVA